MARRIRVEPRK